MGICLDTDAGTVQEYGAHENYWDQIRTVENMVIPETFLYNQRSNFMDTEKIKFDAPKVPVIFVLGGPGSGKVTHCDTFSQETKGVSHINMMDILQQYAIGNDMEDFSQLSPKLVTEVLMLEMKMAPTSKSFLISGYPRSMRDVVEYSEKINIVNGVILISWRQSVLQRQIDYGAKLGHVVLSLAKMELENFFQNVMPVADYFDESRMLIAVNGERSPEDVYADFKTSVLEILNSLENAEAILNGITGMGKGVSDIPGSIITVVTAPNHMHVENLLYSNENVSKISAMLSAATRSHNPSLIEYNTDNTNNTSLLKKILPPIIWVIGGPGSNKQTLCSNAASLIPGWGHISIGQSLRAITSVAPRANTNSFTIKEALSAGEMAPENCINNLLELNIQENIECVGIIIDGFPRTIQQLKYIEKNYQQKPSVILLDCSKLQLGRGRIDDSVSSFRRRLELFREQTLPMLRVLDNQGRLQIIDGDTDSPSVQKEFERIINVNVQNLMYQTGRKVKNEHSNKFKICKGNGLLLQELEINVPAKTKIVTHHAKLMEDGVYNYQQSAENSISDKVTNINQNFKKNQFRNFRKLLKDADLYPNHYYM